MSIRRIDGCMFNSGAQALLNPVNCVGVVSTSCALDWRFRYPAMFTDYIRRCNTRQVKVGRPWTWQCEHTGKTLINFPDRFEWRPPVDLRSLQLGLEELANWLQASGIKRVAMPLLGVERGGLSVASSEQLMRDGLGKVSADVTLYSSHPQLRDDLIDGFTALILANDEYAIAEMFAMKGMLTRTVVEAVRRGQVQQLIQLRMIPGVGIKTLETIYRVMLAAQRGAAGAAAGQASRVSRRA